MAEAKDKSTAPTDDELLLLFKERPEDAWHVFIGRYSNFIVGIIRSLGFDYDEAMDRFTYICERLSEKDYRRLKQIRYAGDRGDLTPWIRQVVKRLCISWAWSTDGRKRLLKPIEGLPRFEQRVFELYFWEGLTPSQIDERLRQEHFDLGAFAVYEALDRILTRLSQKKLWRLISNLARARSIVSLDALDEELDTRESLPTDPNDPESQLIQCEQDRLLQQALSRLPDRQLLVLQFRFEHALSFEEIAGILGLGEAEVRRLVSQGLKRLRLLLGRK